MENILPIILAGGNGTRLWPLSRESYPKQFIKFYDDSSLFQASLTRLHAIDARTIITLSYHYHYRFSFFLRSTGLPHHPFSVLFSFILFG